MAKNIKLVNIYIKIHNKKTLTMDDLKYLSKYDKECFAKTCRNLVYNIPEAKQVLKPEPEEIPKEQERMLPSVPAVSAVPSEKMEIEAVLNNLKLLELKELPVMDVDAETVKELLGSLYMELLFPHNDKDRYFDMADNPACPSFNKKA